MKINEPPTPVSIQESVIEDTQLAATSFKELSFEDDTEGDEANYLDDGEELNEPEELNGILSRSVL